MRVSFLLPGPGAEPVGGFKVAYEYANGLVRRGHHVAVLHPANPHHRLRLAEWPRSLAHYLRRYVTQNYGPDSWFHLDPAVRAVWVPSLHARYVPDAEVVIATAWQTAEWLLDYGPEKGCKLYLVYDYEHYMHGSEGTRARMARTYRSGIPMIASSPAVAGMLRTHGVEPYMYISNGVDIANFRLAVPADDPSRTALGFPGRAEVFKGTSDAVQALGAVRAALGEHIRIWSFGGKRVGGIPKWVEYHERPSDATLGALYNRTAVFVVPSHYEGWGLPGAEAMACGAALVSTDNGGVRAYAEHEKTALLSPPRDPDALAANVLSLLQTPTLRLRLARAGYAHIQQFAWSRAVDAFERVLQSLTMRPALDAVHGGATGVRLEAERLKG